MIVVVKMRVFILKVSLRDGYFAEQQLLNLFCFYFLFSKILSCELLFYEIWFIVNPS